MVENNSLLFWFCLELLWKLTKDTVAVDFFMVWKRYVRPLTLFPVQWILGMQSAFSHTPKCLLFICLCCVLLQLALTFCLICSGRKASLPRLDWRDFTQSPHCSVYWAVPAHDGHATASSHRTEVISSGKINIIWMIFVVVVVGSTMPVTFSQLLKFPLSVVGCSRRFSAIRSYIVPPPLHAVYFDSWLQIKSFLIF